MTRKSAGRPRSLAAEPNDPGVAGHPPPQGVHDFHLFQMSLKEFSADTGAAINDESAAERFAVLDIDLVVPSLTNPRTSFNETKLAELAESIKANGVHQPILVRPLPRSRMGDTFRSREAGKPLPTHEIVTGERRYRASKLAGAPRIPAMIRQLDDATVLEIQIVENLQRDDLSELEEAEGYQRLCDETGIAKEDVGAKIGKSRSYVYQRLKLLALSNTARDALRKGTIDASKALLIARIPDERLQQKALEEVTRTGYNGDTMSERSFKQWLRMNVMLKLADARFKIVDATLRPEAGACTDCEKRTGANPDLFADVDGPDVCTDPTCFHAKEEAHNEQIVAQAKEKGMEVIEGKEAKELMPYPGSMIRDYTELSSKMREELSERELKGKVKLFLDPFDGKAIEVVPDALASKAHGKSVSSQMARQSAKQLAKDKEREAEREAMQLAEDYQDRWRTRAIEAIKPRIVAGEIRSLSANLLRRVILEISMADQRCGEGTAADVLELSTRYDDDLLASTLRSLDDNQIGFTLLLILLEGDRHPLTHWEKAEIRAEREPKAAPATELAAPQGEGKKGKKSTKPAAQARLPKTSKEEASKSIAAALQALDAGPGGAAESTEGAAA